MSEEMNWKAHAELHKNIGTLGMSEPYDLTKIGPVLSLEPVVIQMTDYADFSVFYTGAVVHIDHSKRYPYMSDSRTQFQFARHILRKITRPMTAHEIAMLPRGTAFVGNDASEVFCPAIVMLSVDAIEIGGYMISEYCGYRLPNETEILPFTTEESK